MAKMNDKGKAPLRISSHPSCGTGDKLVSKGKESGRPDLQQENVVIKDGTGPGSPSCPADP